MAREAVTEETLTEIATNQLIADIVTGQLKPGQKLRIEQLKRQYSIGASPLREALARLTSQGFVINETRRGFKVAPVSVEDLEDITLVRQQIETAALRRAIQFGDKNWEMGIITALARLKWAATNHPRRQGSTPEIESAHQEFHSALISTCRSPRLLLLHKMLFEQASRYRRFMINQIPEPAAFAKRHEQLAKIVLSRKADRACAALVEHLGLVAARVTMGGSARSRKQDNAA